MEQNAFTLNVDEQQIATLTFDDAGEKVNKLTAKNLRELERVIDDLEQRSDIKALILRSGKEGNFVAGADVSEIAEIREEREAAEKAGAGQELLNRIEELPFTTIAFVRGGCYGGGTELALACDFRIASDHPKTAMALPEVNLGIIPGFGGTYRLPRRIGLMQGLTMITSGKPADAKKAAKTGLVDRSYPDAFHEEWGRAFLQEHLGEKRPAAKARKRRKKPPLTVRFLENSAPGRRILFSRTKKEILRKTGGKYPAPLRALSVISRTHGAGRKKAIQTERTEFAKLAVAREAKNLTGLFFAREKAKGHPIITEGEKPAPVQRAAVLGAGVMGGKIAWLFSQNDIPVVMKDIAWEPVRQGYAAARTVYEELRKRGKYTPDDINLKMNKIHGAVAYEAIGSPDYVVEAVVEKMEVKKQVLRELESRIDGGAVIATNTSALSVSEMATVLEHRERFGGMHFFNPANRMPLVEVIRGRETSRETLQRIASAALSLGKTPVIVSDGPGFLVNRILMPYLNEALIMLDEGVSVVETDRQFTRYGMPMGPFRLLDEVGIDVAADVAETLIGAFSNRMETGGFFERAAARENLLGKKSGKGFYLYRGKGKEVPNPQITNLRSTAMSAENAPTAFDILHRPLLSMVNEAARCLEEKIVDSPEELDLAMIMGTGFPAFRGGLLRWADTLGMQEIDRLLKSYADRYGKRFEPARLIESHLKEGRGFHR
jgi:3-hydroxyacyl-CoA dehydrogenase/enoyl-CoA hydratase/3-hydroxybutyryl-CoA epimerase